ncbi:zinc ABC transporter ATP-binding protein AztA [Actinophytocola glycyrrhizae]|uniref:Zinc ABC transporter ATP-binding protein AztA n=1 Tax=Actinophytocola glycyrrhizae TaxID=2044873 RepID=A0ABV9RV89_9PSEU
MTHTEIEIADLVVRYGRQVALRGLTTDLPGARVTALLGPNGSGKSSLLGVIAGVVPRAAGTVERRGTRRPAYVVQRSAVDTLPVTVRDTVAMGRWAHRGPWRRLTRRDRAVVDNCLDRLDIGDLAGRPLGALSGGQRQRALVAQGLAQESGLLLLDEPAAGVDLAAGELIATAVAEEAARGVTVVLATHDLATAERAGHCLLLADGRLLAQGPPGEVLTPAALARTWFPAAR